MTSGATGHPGEPDGTTGPVQPRTPRKRRRVIRPGTEQSSVAGISRDERDEGWSDANAKRVDSAHDAELRRNLPPHWS